MPYEGQLSEGSLEQELQNKELTKGRRLAPQDIDATIVREDYWTPPESTLTVCVLTLWNGYTVVGKAACVEPANFDFAIGRKIARDDARNQIWALEGYRLTCQRALDVLADEMATTSGHA